MGKGDVSEDRLPDTVAASSIDQVMSLNKTMDGQGRVVVFLQGRVDERRLEKAAILALVAEPLLGYRFVDDRQRPYWEKVVPSERTKSFHLFQCSTEDGRFKDFMVGPVRPEEAPQARIGLFRQQEDVICIRSNHMALDGGGAIRYLGLLSRIYRELGKDPAYLPPPGAASRPSPRLLLRGEWVVDAVKAIPRMRSPGEGWGIGADNGRTDQSFIIRQLGPERTKAMRTYAKNEGATMNDLLLAAYFRALVAVVGPEPDKTLRIEVPINLRRNLPDDAIGSISNLSAVYFLNMEKRMEGLQGTVRRVHEQMEHHKMHRTELAELLLLELMLLPGKGFLAMLQEMADFRIAHPVLSNLGIIDPSVVDFGLDVKDVHFIGPTLYPPNVGLGVCTFRDTMTLNMNATSEVTAAAFGRILDHMADELPR